MVGGTLERRAGLTAENETGRSTERLGVRESGPILEGYYAMCEWMALLSIVRDHQGRSEVKALVERESRSNGQRSRQPEAAGDRR